MSEPDQDVDKRPTRTEEEAKEEAEVLLEGWVRVAAVSILAVALVAVGLLQATGLIDLFPFGEGWTVQWLVFVLLAAVVVGLELWGWR